MKFGLVLYFAQMNNKFGSDELRNNDKLSMSVVVMDCICFLSRATVGIH